MINIKFGYIALAVISVAGCQSVPHSKLTVGSTGLSESPSVDAQVHADRINFKKLKKQENRPIVALVLGSGGARGYAHIGVIQVLEQQGIHPDFIVGTSAGSIVGSIYASGKTANELRDIALNMKAHDVRDVKLDIKGFFDGKKVENYVNQQVNNTPLELLKTPMYVVATELKEGKKVVFNYGNTGQAVRASVSIPSMFVPTKIGTDEYVDGGLVSPVPVDVARDLGADIIIAVDILAQPMHADIVIQPDLREKAHIFDVRGREMTIQAGAEATLNQLNAISIVFSQKHYSTATPIQQLSVHD